MRGTAGAHLTSVRGRAATLARVVWPPSFRARTVTKTRSLTLLALLSLGAALARPVAVQGGVLHPVIETKVLPSGREGLPVWFLARLNVTVLNQPDMLRLEYGARRLQFTDNSWQAAGFTAQTRLPAPETYAGSLHISLDVLRALGVPILADTPDVLDFSGAPASPTAPPPSPPVTPPASVTPTSPPAPSTPPAASPTPTSPPAVTPPGSGSQLGVIRSSRRVDRNLEVQRVVLEFSAPVAFTQSTDKTGLNLRLPGVAGAPSSQKLESGDTLSITAAPGGLSARLTTGGGTSTVFTLQNPFRIVVDTTTNLKPSVPPPPDAAKRPPGVTERTSGKLHMVSFDPALYQAHVVSAPLGSAMGVADLVTRAGGVAGMNGGYFDPASSLPVDLVAQGGLMLAPSLERRATLGLDAQGGAIYGYPRPRYVVSGAWGDLTVNTVTARPNPNLLTLFVGDGRTPAGGATLLTLTVSGPPGAAGGTVLRAQTGVFVPGAGDLTLTFDPERYPQLPRTPGTPLALSLNWRVPGWDGVQEAVSAGPLLVSGGRVVLDPLKEGFNTLTNVWRPTRQVAFGTLQGQPTLFYYEFGTPEDFARALAAAGVTDALRMDSGSSATVFYAGGYLNTVWSRPVVNAIVMVPRAQGQGRAGQADGAGGAR